MNQVPNFVHIKSPKISLVIDCRRNTPVVHYFGKILSSATNDDMLAELHVRQEPKCALVHEVPLSLSPCLGNGFTGHPGISLSDQGVAWSVGAELVDIEQIDSNSATFISVDEVRNIKISHSLTFDSSNVLKASTTIQNLGSTDLTVNDCAAPTFAVPDHITKIMSFEGRWSYEFQTTSIDLFLGAYTRENRKGKTSHDNFPGVVLHTPHTTEDQGECYGFHLAWSGNHRTRVELLPEQRTYAQMSELLGSGEIVLGKDESYSSPVLYVSYSSEGLNQLSQQFHDYVRKEILNPQFHSLPRPVHYNTWEGIYFDHDTDTLKQLASIVADVGAERFVLDDGWFKGRRTDRAGLGDWIVDKDVYPDGLQPLIDHVTGLGLGFGIWFEPEMVNPDSDLFRQHPDWVLSTLGNPQIDFRHQLVLDLTRKEVCDYLFNQISDILTEYPQIEYIKWDMNRDINHTGDQHGVSGIHKQTLAVYALIDRVKERHPAVEIESCSSGGARIDYGVLQHTDRVWTSDSNDALDRLSIQRGASFFIPSNLLGSHVGPRDCHITRRIMPIDMRISTAMFCHMGMEMDPRELTEEEKQALRDGTDIYKKNRHLIHNGDLYRYDSDGQNINFGIVAKDKSEALFAYNSIIETRRTQPPIFRYKGLLADAIYELKMIWPTKLNEYSPSLLNIIDGKHYSGEALMQFGMQLPIVCPQSGLVFKLTKTTI
ncbi:alpha-galactosidase [Agaribacter marinus]|uniref:alpha-galactosidase n=1 Tax=Agaribacter marinus TaxID=1431249 RepID=A0AA37T133_9ALTE|nr:alpha-galactosidase [Agaribacter marinus]GLR71715.1 alpha-galactosidase [Agaribacter marinus]